MEINKRTELNIFKIGYYWYEGEHEKDLRNNQRGTENH